eukprot:TRINITY_DN91817_c0_g1_i1.p1 TRINITY_DN91817_c0_g1~~TRINITY_DN91817_c0_g1_i1.p1  ORF type:complete len:359 (+),score=71.31 TRINITY_DN91817_c0_g1_i1:36-1079(+)
MAHDSSTERDVEKKRRWGSATTAPASSLEPLTDASQTRRRWGKTQDPPDGAAVAEVADATATEVSELLVGKLPSASMAAAAALRAKRSRQDTLDTAEVRALGARFAAELFNPRGAMALLSHQNKGDWASMLGETARVQTTPKLRRDFAKVAEGGAVYWPGCVCSPDDLNLFNRLYQELSPWKASPYKRSKHPACVEEERLLASETYRQVVAILREVFGVAVGYSIVNLYADGDDWTDYHRDNYRAEGNRISATGTQGTAHDVTVGASFGASRELRFKHLETGLEFGFPQGNGDVFAFTEPVNSAFQHCIPRCAPASSVGARISVILWGRLEKSGVLWKPGLDTDEGL